jgi:hypothetical protein
MPDPVAYVRFADNGNIRLWSKSAYEGEEFMKPLYTAEALRDVLEQAAKALEAGVLGHGECAAMIRAMKEQIK